MNHFHLPYKVRLSLGAMVRRKLVKHFALEHFFSRLLGAYIAQSVGRPGPHTFLDRMFIFSQDLPLHTCLPTAALSPLPYTGPVTAHLNIQSALTRPCFCQWVFILSSPITAFPSSFSWKIPICLGCCKYILYYSIFET